MFVQLRMSALFMLMILLVGCGMPFPIPSAPAPAPQAVSATSRTAMSWWVGEVEGESGLCHHLVVLDDGTAYANVDPCQGGDNVSTVVGALTEEEKAFFDELYTQGAVTYVENNYIDGQGEMILEADQIAALDAWAQTVYARLIQ